MKKLTILGEDILPGKTVQLTLNVAKLHTHTQVQIPVFVSRSKKDGPVLLLMAGLHGDEINGVEIVRRVVRNGWNKPSAGTIICLPVFNIFGFLNRSRALPDGRDLNRSFPGSKNGSLASQFAYQFMKELAPHVDYVIDFHTGAAQRNNAPQIRCVFKDKESLELAKVFAPPFIVHSGFIPKSIRESVIKAGKKMLLFEGGMANSIQENIVLEGVAGVKRILTHLQMRQFKENIEAEQKTVFLKDDKWLRAPISGMFQAMVENGQKVEKDDVLGMVTDPFGKSVKKIKATESSYVFCINESPVVHKGDAVFHLGFEKEIA
jgi:predicted deacylase